MRRCRICATADGVSQAGFCRPCMGARRAARSRAHKEVRAAIAAGRLAPVFFCRCADCLAPATCYDHRDYSKPLEVDPVCWSCNNVRGPAKIADLYQREAA